MTRVLSVEDSPTQAEELRLILESEGLAVETAADGQEALEKLERSTFDIVISDILMPRLSGYELCRRIKSGVKTREMPVVLLTTLHDPMDIIQGLECGADNFLTKPYDPDYLVARVKNILENRRIRSEGKLKMGVEVFFLGKKFVITSDREQILDLLISTFEDTVRTNQRLEARQGELTQSNLTLNGLCQVAMSLNQARTVEEVVDQAVERVLQLPKIRAAWIFLRKPDGEFTLAASRGLPSGLVLPDLPGGLCDCQRKLLDGNLQTPAGISPCERLALAGEAADGLRYHASIPLWSDGQSFGVLNLAGPDDGLPTEDDLRILQGVGYQVGLALERASLRQRLEERVETSEGMYRSLMDQILDGIFVLDTAGNVLEVNRQGEAFVGRERRDIIQAPYANLVQPVDRPLVEAQFHRALATGSGFVARLHPLRPDAKTVTLEVNASSAEFGPNRFVIAVTRDVTERERAERLRATQHAVTAALAESADLDVAAPRILRAIGQALEWDAGGLWLVDAAENVLRSRHIVTLRPTEATQEFERVTRQLNLRTGEGLAGRVWSQGAPVFLDDPANDPGFVRGEQAVRAGLRSGFGFPIVVHGEVLGVIELFSGEDRGRPDPGLLEMLKTVGNQIGLFAQRERAVQDLRQSEGRYRVLFERNLAGVFSSALGGDILECNEAAAQIVGYSTPDELLGRPADELYFSREEHQGIVDRLRADGVFRSGELRLRRKDGTPVSVLANLSLVHEALSGARIQGTIIDVSERKSLEEQLRESQKMEAVGRLAGGVAHDFNNLLTVILGFSEILDGRLRAGQPPEGEVEEIRKAAERASSLTRQLLAFSRKQVLQPRVLDVNEVVVELERLLRRLIGEDIDLSTLAEPGLGLVMADPGQIEQVIMNLAVNARDAMPEGGKLTIESRNVELDEHYCTSHMGAVTGRYVMLAVSDTGVGMDAATKARIFEPFFTTKEKGKGTGLGLATVYGIVKQSNGHIWVYSEVGKGTTFKIYLPRLANAEVRRVPSPVGVPTVTRGAETILLVEDEEPIRKLARKILEANGYTVLQAASGEEALELAERGPIDLLLTDLVLPGITGRKLGEVLSEKWPTLKLLLMSGYTDDTIARTRAAVKGTAYLEKPFTMSGLLNKVRETLARRPRDAEGGRG